MRLYTVKDVYINFLRKYEQKLLKIKNIDDPMLES